jgi:hypothetical protein
MRRFQRKAESNAKVNTAMAAMMLRAFLWASLLAVLVVIRDNSFPGISVLVSGPPTALTDVPTSEEVDDSTLAADYSTSAFGLEQYTQLREPYRSYPCAPQRIHISQKGNVHIIPQPKNESHFHNQTTEYALDMTVSFSLDFAKCANVSAKIVYRQGFHPEHFVEAVDPLQFSYQSTIENTTLFQSDYIYHATLSNLKAGGHRYWYRIEIEKMATDTSGAFKMGDSLRSPPTRNVNRAVMGRTPDYSFLTAPLPHTPTSIALIGDLGQVSLRQARHIFYRWTVSHLYH